MRHHRHRQERWLHTRISENLEDALKREARRRRLPVSLFVRNVLEGALDLVEDIVGESLHAVRSAARANDPGLDDVYGWQELILNRPSTCTRCATALRAGDAAYRGLSDRSGPPIFLCVACVDRLRRPAAGGEEKST